jgi:Acyclic terpene utilisation family protein AtuA
VQVRSDDTVSDAALCATQNAAACQATFSRGEEIAHEGNQGSWMGGKTVRIGAGAGFADDRVEPAVELVERGDLDYLVFECLAERTIAAAQRERRVNPDGGFNEWLADRMTAVLPAAHRRGTRIVTNMGAANPLGAARVVVDVARELGIRGLKVAAVVGDDVLDQVQGSELPLLERPTTVASLVDSVISANAYLGVEPLLDALRQGADVIITGRVADPSLFLAPLIHELGWSLDDWRLLGTGTAVGHLLECAAQVSGGYFADPPHKPVPELARLGFPLAEVTADGSVVITKTPDTGGQVTVATVTEQLLYEVHNPTTYLTPDVVADFSRIQLTQEAADRVSVTGVSGRPGPETLKVSVGYTDGYIATGEISYAGSNALARGQLALDIVRERLQIIGLPVTEARFDLIGVDAVHRGAGRSLGDTEPAEVRVRVAGRTPDLHSGRRLGREVTSLWLNGPAGGAGATRTAHENIAIVSVLVPKASIRTETFLLES